jgi:hypothetical protein
MMRKKKLKVAFPNEVRITRDGVFAHVDFIDTSYMSRRSEIGPKLASMTDEEILRLHNEIVWSQQRCIAESKPTEMAEGAPQIQFDNRFKSWTMLSDVLRCELTSGSDPDELMICIDDVELSWDEFGRMLKSYMGWGMRVTLLPQEQLFKPPPPEILGKPFKTR